MQQKDSKQTYLNDMYMSIGMHVLQPLPRVLAKVNRLY